MLDQKYPCSPWKRSQWSKYIPVTSGKKHNGPDVHATVQKTPSKGSLIFPEGTAASGEVMLEQVLLAGAAAHGKTRTRAKEK